MRESQKKKKKLKRILAHLQEFFESILENRNDAGPNMLCAGELPQSVTVYKLMIISIDLIEIYAPY